jgi:hypothetical protein
MVEEHSETFTEVRVSVLTCTAVYLFKFAPDRTQFLSMTYSPGKISSPTSQNKNF